MANPVRDDAQKSTMVSPQIKCEVSFGMFIAKGLD